MTPLVTLQSGEEAPLLLVEQAVEEHQAGFEFLLFSADRPERRTSGITLP
jgi:hypothetical protein